MRLASYNVENLFDRAKVMNLDRWEDGRPTLEAFAKLNSLLAKLHYTATDKAAMVSLMMQLGLDNSDQGPFVILRRSRGNLLKRPNDGGIVITAEGRADWVGNLELIEQPIRHDAVLNTARIIADVNADVLAIIEAENRPSLAEFNRAMIQEVGGQPYRHVMVIDGNDDRGIDVGIMCREGFKIESMCSHVDDRGEDGRLIFSRDCPQYWLRTPAGNPLIVLINHLKSKGYGGPAASNARRLAQASRVKEIYDSLRERGHDNVAIVGDFNDTPSNPPLAPLLQQSDLEDIWLHAGFDDGGYPGTYGGSSASNKIDYILLSPALVERVQGAGVNRRGMWPGVRPRKWDVIAELTDPKNSASDHAALWVDLDL